MAARRRGVSTVSGAPSVYALWLMATTPQKLAILFGGTSAEHEISLRSARAVCEHLDTERFEVILCGISPSGLWLDQATSAALLAGEALPQDAKLAASRVPVLPNGVDVVFPVLHGPGGEDGTLQGWLELLGVPFVGSGCVGSALAMDKALTKHVLRSCNIPVVPWTDIRRREWDQERDAVLANVMKRHDKFPLFVKPTAQGSSVGIRKVKDESELQEAMDYAFEFGDAIMVEKAIVGREYEIALLDNQGEVLISEVGEISTADWYDYDSKYTNDTAVLTAPSETIAPALAGHMKEHALKAARVLRLRGMARVDFLMEKSTGRFALNEINTLPGFTSISMFPMLMAAAGVDMKQLVNRLVDAALERAKPSAGSA